MVPTILRYIKFLDYSRYISNADWLAQRRHRYDLRIYTSMVSKYLHGGTSNANESFNNFLCKLPPKSEFAGLPTLEL